MWICHILLTWSHMVSKKISKFACKLIHMKSHTILGGMCTFEFIQTFNICITLYGQTKGRNREATKMYPLKQGYHTTTHACTCTHKHPRKVRCINFDLKVVECFPEGSLSICIIKDKVFHCGLNSYSKACAKHKPMIETCKPHRYHHCSYSGFLARAAELAH